MKIRMVTLVATAIGLTLVSACENDPVSEGAGKAIGIDASVNSTFLPPQASLVVIAHVMDTRGARIPETVVATASSGAIVSVDSVRYVPEFVETRIFVTTGTTFGRAQVTLSAQGLTDTVSVRVVPLEMPDIFEPDPNDPSKPNSDDPHNPPTLTLPVDEVLSLNETDLNDFFVIEVQQTTTLQVELDWAGQSEDLDFIVLDENLDLVDASMATASRPEGGELTLDPGRYVIWVNDFMCTDSPCNPNSWTLYHLTMTPVSGS